MDIGGLGNQDVKAMGTGIDPAIAGKTTDIDFEAAKQTLGADLSKSIFDKLDAADGAQDEKVSKETLDIAVKVKSAAQRGGEAIKELMNSVADKTLVKTIAKALGIDLSATGGASAFARGLDYSNLPEADRSEAKKYVMTKLADIDRRFERGEISNRPNMANFPVPLEGESLSDYQTAVDDFFLDAIND